MSAHQLQLSHWSKSDVLNPYSVAVSEQKVNYKPRGLWVSVDGKYDWEAWCKAEAFRPEALTHRHRVTLSESCNVLHVGGFDSDMGIDRFHYEFRQPIEWSHGALIDWRRVALRYQGIIIAPYDWTQRLEGMASNWYYPWDCASGCIWDASAIEAVELLAEVTA